ncbi:MAG TPA: hypothetical protein VM554_11760 [Acidisarcina sp.]|nr:hypothetical protein [Acidisarcina sp.]
MQFSWRLGLRLVLVAIAAALLWVRFSSPRHPKIPAVKPPTDLSLTMPLNEPGGGEAPADSYEVYSDLYKAPMDEPLAFADESWTDIPQVDGTCLKPTTPAEHEMVDGFDAGNRQRHHWEQKFSIPQGYQLLPQREVSVAQQCLAAHSSDAQCEKYKTLRYVRLLGIPAFDHTHTRALVSVAKSCGVHCGSGGVFAVEKVNGKWQRSETTDFIRDCSWMY